MVERERGESGDDAYRINAALVHVILATLFGSIASVGGYMVVWATTDAKWKSLQEERITNIAIRVGNLEGLIGGGVLPVARERLDQIERRVGHLEDRAYGARQR